MIDKLLDLVAPPICYGCQKVGSVLCSHCEYDITSEPFPSCLMCLQPTNGNNLCRRCSLGSPFEALWCVSERRDVVQRLIGAYKFSSVRSADIALAKLLDARLPALDISVITYVPTIDRHIRERGYDHMKRIANALGGLRNRKVIRLVRRHTQDIQHSVGKKKRAEQAGKAFYSLPCKSMEILLIDDIFTTGATLNAAAKALKNAGAEKVYGLVIARQPLD